MTDILSVEVGDKFQSSGTGIILEVVKIWFEYSVVDCRWETSVTWDANDPARGYDQISGKGREFVDMLRSGNFEQVSETEKSSSNGLTTAPVSTPTVPPASTNPNRQQWEDDFRWNAHRWGLSPSDLGRKIKLGSSRQRNYTIIGAKPRNWKMPILVRGRRGGVYKITAEKAKAGLA